MNDPLDHAIRSALGDIVARSPRPARAPTARVAAVRPTRRWHWWVAAAAAFTAIVGVAGIVVVSHDRDEPPVPEATPALPGRVGGVPVPAATATTAAPTTAAATTTVAATTVAASPCQSSGPVPAAATDVQAISGDIDGDQLDDPVTLYRLDGTWHVHTTSSVKGWASDTVVRVDVHDTMSISFEDIDHSAGATVPPPVAVMAMGQGANDKGILGNFTFLTNSPDYCIQQWTYQAEPFQWVALQEPGHVTGMMCEGAAGSIYYTLVDSEQNDDGSWHVITRRLTHNFTTADIEFLPEQDIADSPAFADQYGNIVGCDHPPLSAPTSGASATTASTAPAGAQGTECAAGVAVPADVTDAQTISGDIDGDLVADTVTLYQETDGWYVYTTSSVEQKASITPVQIDVHDTMSIAFSDIDHTTGAASAPPLAVIVIGEGANDRGITRNFTFLTNRSDYCIGQWTYGGAPFQWVALQEQGHVTGMTCGITGGNADFVLTDGVQKPDGSWHMVSRQLTHDFTVAHTTTISDEVVADSSTIGADYGTLEDTCMQAG